MTTEGVENIGGGSLLLPQLTGEHVIANWQPVTNQDRKKGDKSGAGK